MIDSCPWRRRSNCRGCSPSGPHMEGSITDRVSTNIVPGGSSRKTFPAIHAAPRSEGVPCAGVYRRRRIATDFGRFNIRGHNCDRPVPAAAAGCGRSVRLREGRGRSWAWAWRRDSANRPSAVKPAKRPRPARGKSAGQGRASGLRAIGRFAARGPSRRNLS
jgi:hypothetical protein